MSVKYSHKEIDKIYWKTLLLATGCAVVCILLGCMLLSTLLISEVVDIKHLDIGAAAVLFVASITASLLMKKRIGEGSKGVILVCIGILMGTLLLLNSIIHEWEVNKVPLKIGALVVGGCAMMLESKGKNKKKKRRRN